MRGRLGGWLRRTPPLQDSLKQGGVVPPPSLGVPAPITVTVITQRGRTVTVTGAASDPNLFCYGCAHSAATEPFPSFPSGERPCCFCVRNPDREEWAAAHQCDGEDCRHPAHGVWYDGSPAIRTPMDNYITVDRLDQMRSDG